MITPEQTIVDNLNWLTLHDSSEKEFAPKWVETLTGVKEYIADNKRMVKLYDFLKKDYLGDTHKFKEGLSAAILKVLEDEAYKRGMPYMMKPEDAEKLVQDIFKPLSDGDEITA